MDHSGRKEGGEGVQEVAVTAEGFALLVALMLTGCYVATLGEKPERRDVVFAHMLGVNCVALVCDLITWVVEDPAYTTLLYLVNSLVYALGYVMTGFFTEYLSCFITVTRRAQALIRVIYVNCIIAVALVGLSRFNGMYFSIEAGEIVAGPFAWAAVAYSLVIVMADMVMVWLYRRELGKRVFLAFASFGIMPIASFVIQIVGAELTVTWMGSTLTMLLIYLIAHTEYVRRARARELELSESRTLLTLSQIQPHFLFNTLNSIYYLCDIDAARAQEAIGEFSEYLRENLDVMNELKLVSLQMELDHLKHYLALEHMRFGDSVRVEYKIAATDFMLPSLTVQPLVENAIKHGMADPTEGISITVETKEYDSRYLVIVTDDGIGFDSAAEARDRIERPQDADLKTWQEGGHVGLSIVQSRLNALCGGSLQVLSIPGTGTTAVAEIPKVRGGVVISGDSSGGRRGARALWPGEIH